jgi:hypothetical protein
MTATLTPTPDLPEIDVIDLKPSAAVGRSRNAIATGLMGFSVVAVLVPLLFVLGASSKGASVLSWSFLTEDILRCAGRARDGARRRGHDRDHRDGRAAMAIPLGILGESTSRSMGRRASSPRCSASSRT